jgi:putative protease
MEGNMNEKKIGIVSHYYKKIGVAVINVEDTLTIGDTIHIKGNATDLTQKLESMQMEHKNVEQAKEGDMIGMKVEKDVRENDVVYKQTEVG